MAGAALARSWMVWALDPTLRREEAVVLAAANIFVKFLRSPRVALGQDGRLEGLAAAAVAYFNSAPPDGVSHQRANDFFSNIISMKLRQMMK